MNLTDFTWASLSALNGTNSSDDLRQTHRKLNCNNYIPAPVRPPLTRSLSLSSVAVVEEQ